MRPVIYQIVIEGGSRTYIGSARYLPARKSHHLRRLRLGDHHCRALQRAVNKYGIEAISWNILEEVGDAADLLMREQAWLDARAGKLYNTSPKATNSRLGCKMPEKARQQISASLQGNQRRRGKVFSPEQIERISAGVRLAIADGRKIVSIRPQNLAAYNEAIKAGTILHPKQKPERDALILAAFNEGRLMREIGTDYGVTKGAVSRVIRRLLNPPKGKRSKRC